MLDLFETQPRTHSCVRFMERLRNSLLLRPHVYIFSRFYPPFCTFPSLFCSVLWMAADFQLCPSLQEFVAEISWLIHRLRPVTHPSCSSFLDTGTLLPSSIFYFFCLLCLISPLFVPFQVKFCEVCLCCNHETGAVFWVPPLFSVFLIFVFGRFGCCGFANWREKG